MRKIIITIFLNLIFSQVITDNAFNSARAISLAGATVSSPGGIESVFYNPANLSSVKQSSILVGGSILYEQNFLEYIYTSIIFNIKKKHNVALTFQKLGTKSSNDDIHNSHLSSEKSLSISQGFTLLEDKNSSLRLGYNLNILALDQGQSAGTQGDGSNGISAQNMLSVGLDFGILASLRGKIMMGAFIKNINSPRIGRGSIGQFLPRRLNIGFSYIPFNKLITSFNYERSLGYDTNQFRFGIEYQLYKMFSISSGVQMKPNRIGFGFKSTINEKAVFSYGLLSHPILPLTHNVEIGLLFK